MGRGHRWRSQKGEVIEERAIWEACGKYSEGIWEASGTPGGHGAARGSESQTSMPVSTRIQTSHYDIDFILCF